MADYYTKFSEVFKFTKEQADLFEQLAGMVKFLEYASDPFNLDKEDWMRGDHKYIDIFESLSEEKQKAFAEVSEYGAVVYERSSDTEVWVYAEEGSNLDALTLLVRTVLKMTNDHKSIYQVTWAETCNKMRAGAFGGGYAVMSADSEVFGNVHEMATAAVKALRK